MVFARPEISIYAFRRIREDVRVFIAPTRFVVASSMVRSVESRVGSPADMPTLRIVDIGPASVRVVAAFVLFSQSKPSSRLDHFNLYACITSSISSKRPKSMCTECVSQGFCFCLDPAFLTWFGSTEGIAPAPARERVEEVRSISPDMPQRAMSTPQYSLSSRISTP